ncbi:MAG TPA: hypothetical protein VFB72_05050, partial [Verrucomicrobiae bacterium]|nr:hypothetical protein [Verrucomicrobiae bacterium]
MPNNILKTAFAVCLLCLTAGMTLSAGPQDVLRVGVAEHAFDHLGNIGEQADAAVASGANIIYTTGVGGYGYAGLPPESELEKARLHNLGYTRHAKKEGIKLAIGYVCATSIVGL